MKRKRSSDGSDIDGKNQHVKTVKLQKPPVLCKSVDSPNKSAHVCESNVQCDPPIKFDFASPRTVFESLIAPVTVDDFFANYWEKKPCLIRANGCDSEAIKLKNRQMSDIFSLETLESILEKHPITYVRDVNVVRYLNGQRLNLNGVGRCTVRKFRRAFHRDRGTVQVHQPQRFQDNLWQIMENLESFFGCLVGANVYITPSKSQGLPPHHDDVEVFVVQLEGNKHWRLYKPRVTLPKEYSGDLKESELGRPTVDVILKPGDVMYFPRGTIHQACTESKHGHSTHITISTYQRQTWGDYLLSVFPSMLEEASSNDVSFRRGIPINFYRLPKPPKGKMHSVVDQLLGKLMHHRFKLAETMIEDFMWNRLPPFQVDAESLENSLPTGFPPNRSSKVRLKYPDHVCCLIKKDLPNTDGSNDDDDDDDDDGGGDDDSGSSDADDEEGQTEATNNIQSDSEMLYVYTSLFNDRASHMMGPKSHMQFNDTKGLALKFPTHLLDAMEFLQASTAYKSASQLPVDLPADAEQLLRSLWSSHLLDVRHKKIEFVQASENCKITPTKIFH